MTDLIVFTIITFSFDFTECCHGDWQPVYPITIYGDVIWASWRLRLQGLVQQCIQVNMSFNGVWRHSLINFSACVISVWLPHNRPCRHCNNSKLWSYVLWRSPEGYLHTCILPCLQPEPGIMALLFRRARQSKGKLAFRVIYRYSGTWIGVTAVVVQCYGMDISKQSDDNIILFVWPT